MIIISVQIVVILPSISNFTPVALFVYTVATLQAQIPMDLSAMALDYNALFHGMVVLLISQ